MKSRIWRFRASAFASVFSVAGMMGCTGQVPGAFRLAQQEEYFSGDTSLSVNTKLDMLWVVDNSPSMAPSQKKMRDGFRAFASRYMKPTWDIRVAVITQDTYLANPVFRNYLNSSGGSWYTAVSGYNSPYLNPSSTANPRRSTPFVTPSWWGATSINSSGTVTGGNVKVRHAVKDYGGADLSQDISDANPSLWARLLPGRHDGPVATMCWPANSNGFFSGGAQCHVRDHQDLSSGIDNCVATGGTGNDDSIVQCVNTLMNDTVRSGNPIISTQPPVGVSANAAWEEKLYQDFIVNMSSGVTGLGVEKYFNSIDQLIADNESTSTRFFRSDALRVIIFVTDEDDQSMNLPTTQITPQGYGYNSGSSCPWITVDGHTYRLQLCPQADKLLSVSDFKSRLDEFFRTLDGHPGEGDPNYFAVTITPLTGTALKEIHDSLGENAGGYNTCSANLSTRLFEFLDLVGNGSMKLELTSSDYVPLLDKIGQTVVQKKASFKLARAPTSQEDMVVKIRHGDGSETIIPPSKYVIEESTITITDMDIVLGLASSDTVSISYEPKSVY